MKSPKQSSRAHVAVLASNFWPEPTGTSQTVTEFALYLAGRGNDVRVATSMPYYPQWKIWPEYRRKAWFTENHEGLKIYRSWHFVRPMPSTVTRILHEMSLSVMALANIVRVLRGARVAYIASPALSYAVTCSIIARFLGVPRVLVVKDVMPDAAIELGMMTNPALIATSKCLAKVAYKLAGEIHTLGEGMKRRIAAVSPKAAPKIRIVRDTIDADELKPVPSWKNEFRRQFVLDGVFAVLHTGNMGKKQDLDLLLRAATLLRDDPKVHFYVFGDGAAKEEFLRAREEAGLSNVTHHPLQPRWMLPHMLSGADAVLVSQLAEVVDIVVPSKLLTALAAGAMIIAACAADSETARLVREAGGGIVIPPSQERALVRVIQGLRSGEIDAEECRRAARAFAVATFDRDAVYGPLADRLAPVGAATRSSVEEPSYSIR